MNHFVGRGDLADSHFPCRVDPSARRQTAPRRESDLSFRRPSGARLTPALLGRFYPEFDSSVSAWACSSMSLQGFCAVREYPPCA
jgi:hypothetical protein